MYTHFKTVGWLKATPLEMDERFVPGIAWYFVDCNQARVLEGGLQHGMAAGSG